MQIALNKRRIALLVIAIAVADLWLLWVGGPEAMHHAESSVPSYAFILGPILIAFGVGAQLWMRGKPRYRYLGLLIYGVTIAWSVSFGFVVLLTLDNVLR